MTGPSRARGPGVLPGSAQTYGPVTVWVLGALARFPWAAVRARLAPIASVRSEGLPLWLEAGVGEWAQKPMAWASASVAVSGTLAAPQAKVAVPAKLRALAVAARGAHALHEHGELHAGICPQAIALCEDGRAVLGPPALANGSRPVAQVGYPPLAYVDPQLLRGEGGRWSDIWALGATTLQVVTGAPPFQGLDDVPVVQALARLMESPAPALADLPPAVADLVRACLAVDPASRPLTAAEVSTRLDEAASRW